MLSSVHRYSMLFVSMAAFSIASASAAGALVTDGFSYAGLTDGEVFWEGNSQYNTKWAGSSSSQKELFQFADSGGNPGQAGRLDVALAEKNYIARNTNGVTAEQTLTISSEFQIAITGDALSSGQDGTDDSLIGIQLATTSSWWDGSPWFDFSLIRRSDSTWGVALGGVAMGAEPNSTIGLGDGTSASTSDWFTMEVVLTDNGTTYDASASVSNGGTEVWASSSPIGTPYASGSLLWGGYTTGDNADLGLDIHDVSPISVGDLGKISDAVVDNFSLGTASVPEPSCLLLMTCGLCALRHLRGRRVNMRC